MSNPRALKKLCLNMIVRDEAHVIRECLASVRPYIDYWIICDTGSQDDTAVVIESYFQEHNIPGELHHHEWRDFGYNRSLALELVVGKAQYAWVIDADDYISGEPDFSALTADSYDLFYRSGDNCAYWRRQVFRTALHWQYRGVVHEYPHSDMAGAVERLPGNYYIESRRLGGARNRSTDKYARDIKLLEGAHAETPDDPRTVFYLAQSYYDHGDMQQAEHWYRKRAGMGGWNEEVFYSLLRVGLAKENNGASLAKLRSSLLEAWEYRPARVEPLYHLARLCRAHQKWHQAYLFSSQAVASPYPEDDQLFVDESVWTWRAKDELSIAAYWTGHYSESETLCRQLLESSHLPAAHAARVTENLAFAEAKR